jgi:SprT protein
MNKRRTLRQALSDYIPDAAVELASQWFNKYPVILKITRSRLTKLGDFRGSPIGKPSSISVNHNLNKYSFLVTLLHEMAHAEVHFKYSNRMPPHGKAWKHAYRIVAEPYLSKEIFPDDILGVYTDYLVNPQATSTSYLPLAQALRRYDSVTEDVTVSMLTPETFFALQDGRVFQMVTKLRKRYRCYCLKTKKTYLFSPMAIVKPIESQKTQ